jgi:hypothetical protein
MDSCELAINKIPKFNLSLFYFDKIPYVSGLIFFDLWKIVLIVFSFPTLLARATYMSYGGRGKEEVKRISVTPCSPPPPMGWGRGGGKRGPIFRSSPPVTNT